MSTDDAHEDSYRSASCIRRANSFRRSMICSARSTSGSVSTSTPTSGAIPSSTRTHALRVGEPGVDLETRTELRHGSPSDGILDYADEHGVDLVVMGTRGRSAIDRVLLGSVAENVIRNAERPVMVKRLEE